MLSRVFALFVCGLVFSVIQLAVTEAELECGPNEVFHHCVNCPFEDSCYDRGQILCPAAFLPCSPRCLCKEGFIRKTYDTECIPKEECGAPCEIFEMYTECKQCANETCSSLVNPKKSNCESEETCTPGCVCYDSYYRTDEDSICLPSCNCPEMRHSPDCVEHYEYLNTIHRLLFSTTTEPDSNDFTEEGLN